MNYPENPVIDFPDADGSIWFAQTRDTLADTEIYGQFIRSVQRTFYQSRFYKQFKSSIMGLGITMDQKMPGITSEMADLECHHNLPTLKQAIICIVERQLSTIGYVTTFDVLVELEEIHRNHEIDVIMLTKTNHQAHHANPADFISTRQCVGFPERFLLKYAPYMTLDIAYDILLKLKQEEQYGGSYNPMLLRARDEIYNWSRYNGIQQGYVYLPYNQAYYQYPYYYANYQYPYAV